MDEMIDFCIRFDSSEPGLDAGDARHAMRAVGQALEADLGLTRMQRALPAREDASTENTT